MPITRSGTWIPSHVTFDNTEILAERVKAKYELLGLGMPTLVFLGRGGVEMAGAVRTRMGIDAEYILHAAVHHRDEALSGEELSEFSVGQFPTADEVRGKHLLAIDAVWRSGKKLKFVTAKLIEQGADSVETGVICDMTRPDTTIASPRPDYAQILGYNLGHAIFHWEAQQHVNEVIAETERLAILAEPQLRFFY